MKSQYSGILWHCDSCGAENTTVNDEELPIGLSGEVSDGGNGNQAEWYACKPRCIGPAVRNALGRALSNDELP